MHRDYENKHAYLDAIAIASFAVAPLVQPSSRVLVGVCWTAAVALAVLATMTDYPLGLAKALPADAHHALEAGLGVGLVFIALLFGSVGMSVPGLLLGTLGIVLIGAGVHGVWVEGRQLRETTQ